MKDSVLIFLPDPHQASSIKAILSLQGLTSDVADNPDDVIAAVSKNRYRAVISDVIQRTKWDVSKFVDSVQRIDPNLTFIFYTGAPEPKLVGLENNVIPRSAAYIVANRPSALNSLRDALFAAGRGRVSQELRQHTTSRHSLEGLSRSQLHALRCMAAGKSNAEIAALRGTTVRAVENLNRRTLASLGIEHSSSAAARVIAVNRYLEAIGRPVPDLHL